VKVGGGYTQVTDADIKEKRLDAKVISAMGQSNRLGLKDVELLINGSNSIIRLQNEPSSMIEGQHFYDCFIMSIADWQKT